MFANSRPSVPNLEFQKFFLNTRTIFSHTRSEQFWKKIQFFPLFLSRTIRRLIFAFSALTRGNANCVQNFKVLGGFKILQRSLEDRISETDLVLKGLSLISDLMTNEATNQVLKLDKSWCALQAKSLYRSCAVTSIRGFFDHY